MTRYANAPLLMAMLLSATACRTGASVATASADTLEAARRGERLATALALRVADPERDVALARWVLPEGLAEISGVALTADGRLLAHGDEIGGVFEIDFRRGVVVKEFMLGPQPVRDDFEGITVVGDRLYLLASNGTLYEFREGARGARVAYAVHDTHLGRECEFEGLAFDASINALLLACKRVGTGKLKAMLVIYRWRLAAGDDAQLSTLTVPLALAIGDNDWTSLHPSDIAIDPSNGNYVVVAAQEQALVVLTPGGDVVSAGPLPEALKHTEGVAITADGLLILSDEAGKTPATISLYRWR